MAREIIGMARKVPRRWGVLLALVLSVCVGLVIVRAVHATGALELDGDASSNTAPNPEPLTNDWDRVCYQQAVRPASDGGGGLTAGQAQALCTANSGTINPTATAVSWVSEPSGNASIFTGGGSKDPQDINQWAWKNGAGGLPDKDNLLHAFAARYSIPGTIGTGACPNGTDANGGTFDPSVNCELLFFGSDRLDNSGDAQQGFWFFQNRIGLGSNAVGGGQGFSSDNAPEFHRDGDILIISDFSNGGTTSTINVYSWDHTVNGNLVFLGGGNNAKCDPTLTVADPFCGIVNPGTITMPWTFVDKSGTPSNGALNGEFYEAGINLSLLPGSIASECFASISAETRSSTSTTATLKDFVLGNFGDCTATLTTTPSASIAQPVTPGTSVTDLLVVQGHGLSTPPTPTGNVTFFMCGPTAANSTQLCDGTTGNVGTQVGAVKTLGDSSPPAGEASATSDAVNTSGSPLAPGRYCFRSEWPGDTHYKGPFKEFGTADGSECFLVIKLDSTTTTSPSDISGNPLGSSVIVGTTLYDKATVAGTSQGGDPTGTVNFFLCSPSALDINGLCSTGGVAVGANVALTGDNNPSTYTATAMSTGTSANATGKWCFRAEYSGDNTYKTSSDSSANECVLVTDSTNATSAQNWLPNDSATISSTGGLPLNGTVTFTLYQSNNCTGTVLIPASANTFTLTNASTVTERTKTTGNTTVKVTASTTVSWGVVYTPNDANTQGKSICEVTQLTITN